MFKDGASPIPGLIIGKDAPQNLHTPTLYVLGGPTDLAYENGMDDFKRIQHVPVMVANLDAGHGGTFLEVNGGRAASVAASWLDWQFRADQQAAARFAGASCGLCRDPAWTVERNQFAAATR